MAKFAKYGFRGGRKCGPVLEEGDTEIR